MTRIALSLGLLGSILFGGAARAGLVPIEAAAFSGDETVVTYTGEMGESTLVAIDSRTFGGVLHEYRVKGVPSTTGAQLVAFAMPVSSHTKPPRVIGNADDAVLSLTLPGASNRFGLDFLLNYPLFVPQVLEITAYDPAGIALGALTYDAHPDVSSPDPVTGGFAGIESATPFTRVELRFGREWGWVFPDSEVQIGRVFLIDNLRFESAVRAAVPEPAGGALIMLVGLTLALRAGGHRCPSISSPRSTSTIARATSATRRRRAPPRRRPA